MRGMKLIMCGCMMCLEGFRWASLNFARECDIFANGLTGLVWILRGRGKFFILFRIQEVAIIDKNLGLLRCI